MSTIPWLKKVEGDGGGETIVGTKYWVKTYLQFFEVLSEYDDRCFESPIKVWNNKARHYCNFSRKKNKVLKKE